MYATRQGKAPAGGERQRKDRSERSEGTGEGSSSAYARMKRQSEQQARQFPTDESGSQGGRGK